MRHSGALLLRFNYCRRLVCNSVRGAMKAADAKRCVRHLCFSIYNLRFRFYLVFVIQILKNCINSSYIIIFNQTTNLFARSACRAPFCNRLD